MLSTANAFDGGLALLSLAPAISHYEADMRAVWHAVICGDTLLLEGGVPYVDVGDQNP